MGLISYVRQLVGELGKDKIPLHNAAFAYTALFALGPLLLIVISVVGLAFGQEAIAGSLAARISDIVGPKAAGIIQNLIAHTYQTRHNFLGLIIGVISLVLGASGLVNQLRSTLNHIFQAVPDPAAGLKQLIVPRIKNIGLLVLGCALIIVTILASGLVAAVGSQLEHRLGLPAAILEGLNILTSLAVISVVLAAMYHSLPDVRIPWRISLWAGAAVGSLFVLGKTFLGWIIAKNAAGSAYGAAAALISLLLWFYYIGQILFTGAEAIKIHAKNHAVVLPPKKYSLKRKTLATTLKSPHVERLINGFTRGFDKKRKS